MSNSIITSLIRNLSKSRQSFFNLHIDQSKNKEVSSLSLENVVKVFNLTLDNLAHVRAN